MRRFRLTYQQSRQSVSRLNFQSGQSLLFHSALYPSSEATNKNIWGGFLLLDEECFQEQETLRRYVEFDNEEDDDEVTVAWLEQDLKFVLICPILNALSPSGTDFIELVDAFSYNISILDYDDENNDEQQQSVYYYGYDHLSTITDILYSGAVK
ncbi:MAG: hypothetical protein EZS28_032806 [Streblomastix strix]|uniref:Uncharacterized protein n=1 Tax=Streblomastix strix TaxID=222440 RepID=A0A5J4UMQ2_9EUKA|nr:MAG: hypothetical protein EZS28_032806 [Streblomastix strix]